MRKLLRVVGGLILVVVLLVAGLLIGARFADGPLAIVAGGPFKTGEPFTGPEPDWSFLAGVNEVEFQLLEPARSRTTWILDHEGKAYIPCGYMTTWWGKIWKQWPHEVLQDGRILLRVDGKIYERKLVRHTEGAFMTPVLEQLSRKYMNNAAMPADVLSSGYLWIFEVVPRD